MARPGSLPHQSRLYRELSRLYEPVFTRFFGKHIWETIRSLEIPSGAKILEIGVGTGLSLDAYPRDADVTAVDLSPSMLEQARGKVQQHGWDHIRLLEMDAMDLKFPDACFDYVIAFHVVTVVPDHQRLIREMIRVTKRGGTMAIINHFRSERRWLAPLVDLLDPVTRRLGWRTTLRFDDLMAGAPLRVDKRYKPSSRSLFTIVTARRM